MNSIKAAVWLAGGASILFGSVAGAAEYPCSSDPGFCYRDIGDDGCFDPGTDLGPINTDIESSETIPPGPPDPGSIVCPPSVKKLVPTSLTKDIRLKTAAGSSILFYAAKLKGVRFMELESGERILLGGVVGANADTDLVADGDIVIEEGISSNFSQGSDPAVFAESATGDVLVGPKARFRGSDVTFSSLTGDVRAEQTVLKLLNGPSLDISAGQDVILVRPRLTAKGTVNITAVEIEGQSVTFEDKAKITMTTGGGFPSLVITATAGDVEIERLLASIDAGLAISGDNVSIGRPDGNGVVRPSRITQRVRTIPVDVSASSTLAIDSLSATTTDDVNLTTSGPTANVINSTFKGKKATPTVTVLAGAGSTCDLTGTTVRSATLVTNCDTVVGP